ncbi:hypothetical protein EBB07_26620 [Paenibacillaceae bacterium]|nr:hypothetical protein EBB07_26620 [Paenibacillaceae bacterium]
MHSGIKITEERVPAAGWYALFFVCSPRKAKGIQRESVIERYYSGTLELIKVDTTLGSLANT